MVLITVNFWPKNLIFEKKWIFYPFTCSDPHSCIRTFVWWLISYLSMEKKLPALSSKKYKTNCSIFTPTFLAIFHQTGFRQYILVTILHELLQCISKHTTLFNQTNLFRDTVWATLQWKSRKTD